MSSLLSRAGLQLPQFVLFFVPVILLDWRLKSVSSFLSVRKTCLLVSVPSVYTLPVWTRNRVIVKNVEFAGKSIVQGAFTRGD